MITCPACTAEHKHPPFYQVDQVPVHQVKLMRSREEAVSCQRGDISLQFCEVCGFIWNAAFNPALMSYAEDYESTQAVSPTFNTFHERLAREMVERFDLRGKRVVELGCGQGEFVRMLVAVGAAEGFGFDTVVRKPGVYGDVCLVKELYGEPYRNLAPDFVVCKMTLEHVPDVAGWLRSLRRIIGDRTDTIVVFMIPEVTRILKLRAFWDIYYEHCSYWSPGSLARAFRRAGFDPIGLWTEYDDQYVLIAARPGVGSGEPLEIEESPAMLEVQAVEFKAQGPMAWWRGFFDGLRDAHNKALLWGGGSKAVAFLTTLGITDDQLPYVIDINPRRHGTFIAGTGQRIMPPEFLLAHRPAAVVVMSPIYLPEIRAHLEALDLRPRLFPVEMGTPG